MQRFHGLRRYAGFFLMLAGLALVGYSLYSKTEWHSEQQKLLAMYDAEVLAETELEGNKAAQEQQGDAPETVSNTLQQGTTEEEKAAALSGDQGATKKADTPKIRMKPMATERKGFEDGMMVVTIPALDIRAAVINGTSTACLKKGPCLYEDSPLPGQKAANVCIAAHRNMYGSWFRYLERLRPGEQVLLECGRKTYTYEIEKVFTVNKSDWSALDTTGYEALTLTTCSDRRNPDKRVVARCRLKKIGE